MNPRDPAMPPVAEGGEVVEAGAEDAEAWIEQILSYDPFAASADKRTPVGTMIYPSQKITELCRDNARLRRSSDAGAEVVRVASALINHGVSGPGIAALIAAVDLYEAALTPAVEPGSEGRG